MLAVRNMERRVGAQAAAVSRDEEGSIVRMESMRRSSYHTCHIDTSFM